MIVSDIMTRDVVSVTPASPLEQAVRLMVEQKLSGLPVLEKDGTVAGMITEGDLMRRPEIGAEGEGPGWFEVFFMPGTSAYDYLHTHARTIGMLMSSKVVSIAPTAALADAAKLMREHSIKRLPVVDKNRLVGIIARADLVKVLADVLQHRAPLTDSEIRRHLSSEMAKQKWLPRLQVDTKIDNGVVEYRGTIFEPLQRDALHVLAELAGARRVSDKLVCIEPISGAIIG